MALKLSSKTTAWNILLFMKIRFERNNPILSEIYPEGIRINIIYKFSRALYDSKNSSG